MPRERKFNFVPFVERTAPIEKKEYRPFVKIDKPGIARLNKKSIEALGYEWGPKIIKLFHDYDKRAIAFKFVDSEHLDGNGIRILKPHKYTTSEYFQFSVMAFTSSLKDISFPTPRLYIEDYNDNDEMIQLGKLHCFIIPRASEIKKERKEMV